MQVPDWCAVGLSAVCGWVKATVQKVKRQKTSRADFLTEKEKRRRAGETCQGERYVLLCLSIKARNLCVCVCLKNLRIRLTWDFQHGCCGWRLKDVQPRICFHYKDTVKLFNKCFTNSASIVNHSHHSHASWNGILPAVRCHSVHLNWLLWINETEQVQTESAPA